MFQSSILYYPFTRLIQLVIRQKYSLIRFVLQTIEWIACSINMQYFQMSLFKYLFLTRSRVQSVSSIRGSCLSKIRLVNWFSHLFRANFYVHLKNDPNHLVLSFLALPQMKNDFCENFHYFCELLFKNCCVPRQKKGIQLEN